MLQFACGDAVPMLLWFSAKQGHSVDDHGRLVVFVSATVEIIFVDDARSDRLMLLPKIKHERVRRGSEDVRKCVRLVPFDQAHLVRDSFSQSRGVGAAPDALVTWTLGKREGDQAPDLR
jgi:hypothetical protein